MSSEGLFREPADHDSHNRYREPKEAVRLRRVCLLALGAAALVSTGRMVFGMHREGHTLFLLTPGAGYPVGAGPAALRLSTRFSAPAGALTEAQTSQARLAESEAFARKLAKISSNLHYVRPAERHIVTSNGDIANYLGYSPEEVEAMGTSLAGRIVHPDDLEATYRRHASELFAGFCPTMPWWSGKCLRHADGSWRWMHGAALSALRRGPDGQVHQIVGSMVDVTERRAAAERYGRAKSASAAPSSTLLSAWS